MLVKQIIRLDYKLSFANLSLMLRRFCVEEKFDYSYDDSNINERQRQDGMGVESVSVADAHSLADTLEIYCHFPTRVATSASSGIHGTQKIYKLSKLFNERLHTKSLKYST